jgi:hypothetical protein
MHFGIKSYLKSNRYHIIKHPLNKLVSIKREKEREREICGFLIKGPWLSLVY